MWYSPLGFCLSLFGGWLISVILDYFNMAGESTIYMDENKKIINADLFTPPLAKRIRKQNAEILGKNFEVRQKVVLIFSSLKSYLFSRLQTAKTFFRLKTAHISRKLELISNVVLSTIFPLKNSDEQIDRCKNVPMIAFRRGAVTMNASKRQ